MVVVLMATNDCAAFQAYSLDKHLALQFHLEMHEDTIRSLIEKYSSDLEGDSDCVQAAEASAGYHATLPTGVYACRPVDRKLASVVVLSGLVEDQFGHATGTCTWPQVLAYMRQPVFDPLPVVLIIEQAPQLIADVLRGGIMLQQFFHHLSIGDYIGQADMLDLDQSAHDLV